MLLHGHTRTISEYYCYPCVSEFRPQSQGSMRLKRQDLKTQDDEQRAKASHEEVGPLPALQITQRGFAYGGARFAYTRRLLHLQSLGSPAEDSIGLILGLGLCCVCKKPTISNSPFAW